MIKYSGAGDPCPMTVDASFLDWVSGSAMLNCVDPATGGKKSGDSQHLI